MAVLSNIGFKRPTYAEILDAQIARAKTLFGDDIETSELTILGKYIRLNVYDIAKLYEELEKRNPLNHLSDIKRCPLLLINGECDTSVDPRAQAHFFDAFKKAGGAGEKIEYPGLGHFVTTNMMDDAVAWMETVK